jgi:protein TonB
MRFIVLLGYLGFSLFLSRPAASQALVAPATTPSASTLALPANKTFYFNSRGQQIAPTDSVDHREELVYRDSIGGTVRVYYPSGKLRRIISYLHFGRGIQYGGESSFYETGEIKSHGDYNLQGLVGAYEQFYRSGQVRMRTSLTGGLLGQGQGERYGPDGKPAVENPAQDKLPSLGSGGSAAIAAAVQRGVRYPVEALRARATGQVVVTFMVDDAGFVRNVQVVKSASPLLDGTVLRSVAALGRLTPGQLAGEPIDVFFTVPVTFAIR